MSPRTPSEEREHNEDQQAEMRVDMRYMRSDIKEIKDQLKFQAQSFITRDQMSAAFTQRDDRLTDLEAGRKADRERSTFYVRAVVGALLTAILTFAVVLYQAYGVHK
jgi:hypothetical protein